MSRNWPGNRKPPAYRALSGGITAKKVSGGSGPTLCFPDNRKSCFACCPPIRPPNYEHIQYKNLIQRMLRENTRAFSTRGEKVLPITGFSCWALGYLDKECRLVGCLLHPSRNRGKDLRFRVDYGGKCGRESCPESKVFLELGLDERELWLCLAGEMAVL